MARVVFLDTGATEPRYLSEPADLECLLVSVKTCRELGNTSAFDDWNAGKEVFPEPRATSDEDLEAYVRSAAATYHHQVGTCKMGIDALSVVDPELRVHGVEGLRVADASIMPSVTSDNTNAPAIMIGEKAAASIQAARASASPVAVGG